jgi:hypothetical protein
MAEHTSPGTQSSTRSTSGTAGNSTESSIVGKVREQATSQLNTQKNRATDGIGSVAQAARDTTRRLRDEKHDTVARYVEQAADQIERFSERLKNKDVGELMSDAQRLARRQPALFVGGAFAVGLLGARFLKSSAERDTETHHRTGYGTDYSGSDAFARARADAPGATTNAYGNQVPTPTRTATTRSRAASVTNRDTDYPPTEGI